MLMFVQNEQIVRITRFVLLALKVRGILNFKYFCLFLCLILGVRLPAIAEPTNNWQIENVDIHGSSELPEMVVVRGAEKFGFRSASKFEITWSQYRPAVESGGCGLPVGFRVEETTGPIWRSERTSLSDPRFSTDFPVTGISRSDMDCFLTWLNGETGQSFKLPTAHQWRWLSFGSNETLFPWGDVAEFGFANISANNVLLFDKFIVGKPETFTGLLQVGRFPPNEFGLYDTIGNAGELVDDCTSVRLANSQKHYPSCLVMGRYDAPLLNNPRSGAVHLLVSDATAPSVGFRIIE